MKLTDDEKLRINILYAKIRGWKVDPSEMKQSNSNLNWVEWNALKNLKPECLAVSHEFSGDGYRIFNLYNEDESLVVDLIRNYKLSIINDGVYCVDYWEKTEYGSEMFYQRTDEDLTRAIVECISLSKGFL